MLEAEHVELSGNFIQSVLHALSRGMTFDAVKRIRMDVKKMVNVAQRNGKLPATIQAEVADLLGSVPNGRVDILYTWMSSYIKEDITDRNKTWTDFVKDVFLQDVRKRSNKLTSFKAEVERINQETDEDPPSTEPMHGVKNLAKAVCSFHEDNNCEQSLLAMSALYFASGGLFFYAADWKARTSKEFPLWKEFFSELEKVTLNVRETMFSADANIDPKRKKENEQAEKDKIDDQRSKQEKKEEERQRRAAYKPRPYGIP